MIHKNKPWNQVNIVGLKSGPAGFFHIGGSFSEFIGGDFSCPVGLYGFFNLTVFAWERWSDINGEGSSTLIAPIRGNPRTLERTMMDSSGKDNEGELKRRTR